MAEETTLQSRFQTYRLEAQSGHREKTQIRLKLADIELESQPLLSSCREADCVVLLTNHSSFDYEGIVNQSSLIVDTRNAFRSWRMEKIVRL